jgi:hypothetical protein
MSSAIEREESGRLGRFGRGEIVTQIAKHLRDAAAEDGVEVSPIYCVVGAGGERFYTTLFDEAVKTRRRVAAGERAA